MENNIIFGLFYQDDFLNSDEEKAILLQIEKEEWDSSLKRRFQHYGYIYDYKKKNISQDSRKGELPDWLFALEKKIKATFNLEQSFDQVIINEYEPGQGISNRTLL